MILRKYIFLVISFMGFSIFSFSQIHNQIVLNDSSHLIQSGYFYDAEVLSIKKLKTGIGVFVKVKIDENKDAYGFVISCNRSLNKKHTMKCKHLHKGDVYRMLLIDYFNEMLVLSIEYKRVYDVLLGEQKIVVPAGINGFYFSRIFVSPNIKNGFYYEETSIPDMERYMEKKSTQLKDFLMQFINCISFDKEFYKIPYLTDSVLFKKSLQSFSFPYLVVSPNHPYNKKNNNAHRRNFLKINWANEGVNPNIFFELTKAVFNDFFKLPLTEYNEGFFPKEIDIRLLYLDECYSTVELKWIMLNYIYTVVVSLTEENGTFKIIGLNMPVLESCKKTTQSTATK